MPDNSSVAQVRAGWLSCVRKTWERRGPLIAVAVLLSAYAIMVFWSYQLKGSAFDEGEQLATGYNIWRRGDFRMESANGDFVKRWATLPFLITRPNLVSTTDQLWRSGDAYWVAEKFLFESGNDADTLLLQGRAMIVLLGLATGLTVYFCARELFGSGGGLVALSIFVFSPSMLAFGGIVSTEMSLCLGMLGSAWCIWALLHRITWRRIAGSLALFAVLVLTKPTAVLMLPATGLMVVIRLALGRPLEVEVGSRRVVTTRWAQTQWFLALTMVHALVGWSTIWAHYDFRYAASPNPADPGLTMTSLPLSDRSDPVSHAAIAAARRGHWLPQGVLHGVEWLLSRNDEKAAFLAGEWTIGGWRRFFLHAALAKTRPEYFVLLTLGLIWWWRGWRAKGRDPTVMTDIPSPYHATPYLAVIWPQAILMVALVVVTLFGLVRQTALGFAGAWFFLLLAPSSSVLPIVTQTIAEHRMYLPLAAPIAVGVLSVWSTLGSRSLILLALVGLAFGIVTAYRNTDYRSAISIWQDTVEKRPENARAFKEYGDAL